MSLKDLFARPGIGLNLDLGRFVKENMNDAKLMFHWSW